MQKEDYKALVRIRVTQVSRNFGAAGVAFAMLAFSSAMSTQANAQSRAYVQLQGNTYVSNCVTQQADSGYDNFYEFTPGAPSDPLPKSVQIDALSPLTGETYGGMSHTTATFNLETLTLEATFEEQFSRCPGYTSINGSSYYLQFTDTIEFFFDPARYPAGSSVNVPVVFTSTNSAPIDNVYGDSSQTFAKQLSISNGTSTGGVNILFSSYFDENKLNLQESGSIVLNANPLQNKVDFSLSSWSATDSRFFEHYLGGDKTTVTVGPLPQGVTCRSASGRFPGCDIVTKTTVVYVNGIRTDDVGVAVDAYTMRNALKRSYGGQLPKGVQTGYVFNPTGGTFADLLESTEQKLVELDIAFTEAVGDILRFFSEQPNNIREAVRDEVARVVQQTPSAAVMNAHVQAYRGEPLKDNGNLLIVPHSQGNFYANFAHASLTPDEQRRTRVVSVASPASYTAGDGSYTTEFSDVIQWVKNARLWNVTNSLNPFELYYLDVLGHSFTRWYLHPGFATETKIMGDIKDAISAFEQEAGVVGP